MTQHVLSWLDAYHDGELSGSRLRQVELHLQECETCRAELETLQGLSALLQTAPALEARISTDRFESQVRLLLPSHPQRTGWPKALRLGWSVAPFILIAGLAFGQAALWISQAVAMVLRAPASLLFILFLELAWMVVVAVLLWGWLASWWVLNRGRSEWAG